jgi:PhnB protein
MASQTVSLPPGYHSINPYFVIADAAAFIAFIVTVFGGIEEGEREIRADGGIGHASVLVGDSLIMISQADEKYPARPAVSFAYVDDVDSTYARALAAGSRSILAPADQPWGDRVGGVVDPFENRWWIGTRLRESS